jgi:hypothetical protein
MTDGQYSRQLALIGDIMVGLSLPVKKKRRLFEATVDQVKDRVV